jgi:hypothetical protein
MDGRFWSGNVKWLPLPGELNEAAIKDERIRLTRVAARGSGA